MVRRKILPTIVLALLILSGCKDREDLSFFSQPPEAQKLQASEMTTKQVYRLYKLSFELPSPPTYVLLPAIGERGEEALLAWVDDLRTSEDPLDELWEYGPLLGEIKDRRSATLCQDLKILDEASALLARSASTSKRGAELSLRVYC